MPVFHQAYFLCVTNVPLVPFFLFPPPSFSCLCNRLYILPHVFSLSLLPLCDFLLCLVFPFPVASHMHSSFLLHPLSHAHSIHCSPAKLILHTPWCCLSTGLSLYSYAAFISAPLLTYIFAICIFAVLEMHPKVADFYS